MFRQIAAIFLFVAFIAQTFNGGFVMLNYYTNTAAFAKNCVNKTKPKMHCNGKCQMMKKLQEEEKKEQQLPERKFENKIEVLSFNSFFCNVNVPLTIVDKAIPKELDCVTYDISLDFFHPPQV
jgi:hypothetical protein